MTPLDDTFQRMAMHDQIVMLQILNAANKLMFKPDLVIEPDGKPYLYRWHLLPRGEMVNVYFHLQVGNDPVRPLHDHPYDNHSVILAGGYDEVWMSPDEPAAVCREFRKGDCIARKAEEAHRLLLPDGITYTMTIFTTGPKIQDWGFWYPDGWHSHTRHVDQSDPGRHIYVEKKDE